VDNALSAFNSSRSVPLQFGHDAEVVDNGNGGAVLRPAIRLLQFGHDAEVVDNRGAGFTSWITRISFNSATTLRSWITGGGGNAIRRRRSFNSATTLRSWITFAIYAEQILETALQFGHDAEVVDNAMPEPRAGLRF